MDHNFISEGTISWHPEYFTDRNGKEYCRVPAWFPVTNGEIRFNIVTYDDIKLYRGDLIKIRGHIVRNHRREEPYRIFCDNGGIEIISHDEDEDE